MCACKCLWVSSSQWNPLPNTHLSESWTINTNQKLLSTRLTLQEENEAIKCITKNICIKSWADSEILSLQCPATVETDKLRHLCLITGCLCLGFGGWLNVQTFSCRKLEFSILNQVIFSCVFEAQSVPTFRFLYTLPSTPDTCSCREPQGWLICILLCIITFQLTMNMTAGNPGVFPFTRSFSVGCVIPSVIYIQLICSCYVSQALLWILNVLGFKFTHVCQQ